jgi:hypothetical protein
MKWGAAIRCQPTDAYRKVTAEMSTATLPDAARQNVALFSTPGKPGTGFRMYRKANQDGVAVLAVEKMQVFRSGTFRDSMGFQHTWENMHIEEMVRNFDHLRSRGILPHVPVRKGHPGFLDPGSNVIDSVLGYHTALEAVKEMNPVDGKEYTYLLADYEILGPPEAIDAIQSGRWRNMSSEVGTWVSNDEAEYWPVYQGVAYVDFSAVEGLKNFQSANGVGTRFSIMSEETAVSTSTVPGQNAAPDTPATPPLPPAPPAAQPAGQQTPAPAPVAQHAAPPAPSFKFSINGAETTDFAAVQAHIVGLETFKKESIEAGRKAFVASLVSANKMLAANQAETELWCLTLDDAQFEGYKKQWESVPALPVLENHTGGSTNHSGAQPAGDAPKADDELSIAEETVANHRRAGLSEEAIKKTPSYAKLVKAGRVAA